MTPERARKAAGRIDRKDRTQTVDRPADRIVPVFELLSRRGQIEQAEARAGETYATYWHGARRQPGLVGSYGEQRWSGTSVGQTAPGSLITEEWPVYCAGQLSAARAAIGDAMVARLLDRLVEHDATLEDIGRDYIGYKSPQQAMAAGTALTRLALARLAAHWGFQG